MAKTISKVLYLTVRSIELYRVKYELILDRKKRKTEYTFNCGLPIQQHQVIFPQLSVGKSYRVVSLLVKDDQKWVWTWPTIAEVDPLTIDTKADEEFMEQLPYYYKNKEQLAEEKAEALFNKNFIGPRRNMFDLLGDL